MTVTWSLSLCTCACVVVAYARDMFDWQVVFFTYIVPTFDVLFILLALLTYSFIFMKYNKTKSKLISSPVLGSSASSKLASSPLCSPSRSPNSLSNTLNSPSMNSPSKALYSPSKAQNSASENLLSNAQPMNQHNNIPSVKLLQPTTSETSTDTTKRTSTIGMGSKFSHFKESVYFIPTLLIGTFLLFMVIPDLTYIFVGIVSNRRSPQLLAACFLSYSVSALTDAWIYIYLQRDVRKLMKDKWRRILGR